MAEEQQRPKYRYQDMPTLGETFADSIGQSTSVTTNVTVQLPTIAGPPGEQGPVGATGPPGARGARSSTAIGGKAMSSGSIAQGFLEV